MKLMKPTLLLVIAIFSSNLVYSQFGGVNSNKLKSSANDAAKKKQAEAKAAAKRKAAEAKAEALRKANDLKNSANGFAFSQFKEVAKDIPFKINSARLNLNDPNYKISGVSVDTFMKQTLIPAIAKLIKILPAGKRIHIIGHASRLGSEKEKGQYKGNIWLSQGRARALYLYLKANSRLDDRRFRIYGKGSAQLKNASNPASEENCRVSFDIGN